MPPVVASPGRHAWGWDRNHCGLLVGCAGRVGMALIGVIREDYVAVISRQCMPPESVVRN